MSSPLFIIIVIASILLVARVIVQVNFRKRDSELSEKISEILSDRSKKSDDCQGKEFHSDIKEKCSVSDIKDVFENKFQGKIVSASQKRNFIVAYSDIYDLACLFVKRSNKLRITPSEKIVQFIYDFECIHSLVQEHNEKVIGNLLNIYKDFFDTCLKYPLDRQQRRSIVSEEDNCLVVSSAGSGKTSSIIGKVKYLIEKKGIAPQKILLISYTNKAASELTERLDIAGLRGYTFHKLAIDLIGRNTGIKPSICDNTDALFVTIYQELLEDAAFKKNVIEYFIDCQSQEADWEQRKNEKREQLAEQKKPRMKALLPDMDGKPVYVRSEQEQKICFVLSSLGVRFRYEEPYEYLLADEFHSQYTPDFSIYYEKNGNIRRIYLEHYGIDEHGQVPRWFAEDKNMTYEEANQKYNDGITWKKAAHEKFGIELITTSSADFYNFDIRDRLKNRLENAGVPISEKSDTELYDAVIAKGSKQEKAFIRLVVTFVTLIKSSCKSIDEVLCKAYNEHDERSAFMIKNIFMPVYKRYCNALSAMNKIDFTDAILQATEICRSSDMVSYDYIIVDEFQDISVDRYEFLKVLRDGNPPAKLYCVGDDWQSIYRFSGSDMTLFNHFQDYFGETEINKIETTYRFGEPLVALSSEFIQRNDNQIKKDIHSFSAQARTDLLFCPYDRGSYCDIIAQIINQIPPDKSVFLLGRYSFDDYYLSFRYKPIKRGNKFFYIIGSREVEFMTVHKSKGLEADYVILLQCNKDTYGFPSLVSDNPVLGYVLTESDRFPYAEERRLFYVAITRAKIRTAIMYDRRFPSVFVDEFLHPEQISEESYVKHPNANKRWTQSADRFLLKLHREGKSIKYIASKMGRSQTSIIMRLDKLSKS